jgi:hypothetical protein
MPWLRFILRVEGGNKAMGGHFQLSPDACLLGDLDMTRPTILRQYKYINESTQFNVEDSWACPRAMESLAYFAKIAKEGRHQYRMPG